MESSPTPFDPNAAMCAVGDELQRTVAQLTGSVPQLPFVVNSEGQVVELAEQDIRE